MARERMGLPTGVEFAGQSVRIRFTWKRERRCETLPFPQTAKGIKSAADLRAHVISLAKHGVLDEKKYAELFPNSSYSAPGVNLTFGNYAQSWLDSLEIVDGTRRNYLGSIQLYWMPYLADVPLSSITTLSLRTIIAATQWKSASVRRTSISRVIALFNAAVMDELVERNPATPIQLPPRNRKKVDPFTVAEADSIIEWMYQNFTKRGLRIYAPYFEFAFYSGMRTGEMLALRWDEVDFEKRTVHVCRIVVDGEVEERTKTKQTRTVMLTSRALIALRKARAIADERTSQKRRVSVESPYVFQPSGKSPYIQRPAIPGERFNKALETMGIRHRSQYNCRHTYATMCLMAGMNTAFIAAQLGHSLQVLLTTYAKWIASTADWSEVEKLESQIGTESVSRET